MRLYLKLSAIILLTVAIQMALPSAVRLSYETAFAVRCGIAYWSGDEQLHAELVEEAREMLRQETRRTVAATQRVAEAGRTRSRLLQKPPESEASAMRCIAARGHAALPNN